MRKIKGLKSVGFTLLLLCLSAGTALADFQIAGSSTGEFFDGGPSLGNTFQGLTFNGGNFGPSTSPVVLGNFVFNAPLIVENMMSEFVLTLNFTTPGSGAGQFSADVRGLVVIGLGFATINFDPNTERIAYSNAQGSGSFDLTLSDIAVWDLNLFGSGSPVNIVGTVSNATFTAVPEPSAIPEFLLSIGGISLVALYQRRRLQNI